MECESHERSLPDAAGPGDQRDRAPLYGIDKPGVLGFTTSE